MKYLITLLSFSVIVLLSCNKDNEKNTICIDGIVRYAGNPAADGFGWLIYKGDSITNDFNVPQNLSNNFKVENLKVVVCLQQTDERVSCRCTEVLYQYRVTTIQKR